VFIPYLLGGEGDLRSLPVSRTSLALKKTSPASKEPELAAVNLRELWQLEVREEIWGL